MVDRIIRDYMESGAKKITVPGFGTFMRKDSGEVIFVDLLRKDDGRLRELVEDAGPYSEVEAMALVDRFTFETKNSIERSGSAPIDGFGTMFLDDKGMYQFDYSPRTKPARKPETAVQERLFDDKPAPRQPQQPREPAPQPAAKPAPTPAQTQTPRREVKRPLPRRNKKSDTFIIVAIIAALIAIAVMIYYGYMADSLPFLAR